MTHTHSPRHIGGLRPYATLLLIAIGVFIGETLVGLATGSLALVSDASHTLGDSVAVLLALWFESGVNRRSERANRRQQLLTRIGIGTLILLASVHIGTEGYERLRVGHEAPAAIWVLITAGACIFANRAMLRALGNCQCHTDSHLRMHVKSDIWISIGVLAGGIATLLLGTSRIDAWLSIAIAGWIAILGVQVIFNKHHH